MMKSNYVKSSAKDYIFGTRVVIEAIQAGKEIEKVLIQNTANNELVTELMQLVKHHQIPYTKVPLEKLNRITRKNHQGIICFLSPIQYASLDHILDSCFNRGKDPLIVILDRITDVRNFGAIARTLEAAGADALVIQNKGNAMITGDALKTSAGALNHLPVCRESNLTSAIRHIKNSGLRVVACTEKTDTIIYNTDLKGPLAIVLGSEEDGISTEILQLADQKAKIPMLGKIASLNVSVSTAVILYEAVRQNNHA